MIKFLFFIFLKIKLIHGLELLHMVSMSKDSDEIIRPTIPKFQNTKEIGYLRLVAEIQRCWLEIPEMRPSIKHLRSVTNSNLKPRLLLFLV